MTLLGLEGAAIAPEVHVGVVRLVRVKAYAHLDDAQGHVSHALRRARVHDDGLEREPVRDLVRKPLKLLEAQPQSRRSNVAGDVRALD